MKANIRLRRLLTRQFWLVALLFFGGLLLACQGPSLRAVDSANGSQVIRVYGLDEPREFRFMWLKQSGDEKLWLISPNDGAKIRDWPEISYGGVPAGFKQEVPANGPPPPLLDGERYGIMAVGGGHPGVAIDFFIYRNGKLSPEVK